MRLGEGKPFPLGATWDGEGVNFALGSSTAEQVYVCLFDGTDDAETSRFRLPVRSDGVWHGYLPGAEPGLLYGYRAVGDFAPQRGLWCNERKLLLDPYAKCVSGPLRFHATHLPCTDGGADPRDDARHMVRARVVADHYDWRGDTRPATEMADTIIYELHVKGFSMRNPRIPAAQRGRFSGIAHPASIDYLTDLGVTAIELMPVHLFTDEPMLARRGLANYWGYNTVNFFTPDPRYGTPDEFRDMVRALHAAGIEVILDVVYNHTAESDHLGPMYNLRGLDNATYYHLLPHDRSRYRNDSGCGNTLNLAQPRTLRLVVDSLRYWVREMHVDGFRYDLAAALARDPDDFTVSAPLLREIAGTPELAAVKHIAEPWDLGAHGYRLGQFPSGWSEWNDRFRIGVRDFWLRRQASRGEFAQRLTASADVFQNTQRAPSAGVNYVASHDGFTLADLTCYEHKHNAANLQEGRDGSDDNRSCNCGVEGPSADPDVTELRRRLQRNLLTTLLLATGTPMLHAGDEMGRTQRGNNNAYCQDNELSWLDWRDADAELREFVRRLIALRKRYPHFRPSDWAAQDPDCISWRQPDGKPLSAEDWNHRDRHELAAHYTRATAGEGEVLLLVNAEMHETGFALPAQGPWRCILDTAIGDCEDAGGVEVEQYVAAPMSAVLFRRGGE